MPSQPMSQTKTLVAVAAGGTVGRGLTDWIAHGFAALPGATIFGPMTEAAQADVSTLLGMGVAVLGTWIHHRMTQPKDPRA